MATSSFGGFGTKPAAAPAPTAPAPRPAAGLPPAAAVKAPGLPAPSAAPRPAPAAAPAPTVRAPLPAARVPASAPGVGLPRPAAPAPAAAAPKAAADAAQAEAEAAQQAEQDRVNEEARLAEEAAAQQEAARPAATPAPARRTRTPKNLSLAQPVAAPAAPAAVEAHAQVVEPAASIPQANVGVDDEDRAIALTGNFELPAFGEISGEITSRDVKLPRLALVHPVGKLVEQFRQYVGSFVLNKETLLTVQDQPEWETLGLTILGFTKFYRENLPNGSDALPRQFTALAEVQDAGGSIDWTDVRDEHGRNVRKKPPFSEAALLIVALDCPKGYLGSEVEGVFAFEGPDGVRRTLALWQLTGGAYNNAGKKVITEAGSTLKTIGLPRGKWSLSAKLVKAGDNNIWSPQLARSGVHSVEVARHFAEIMGAVDAAEVTPE